MARYRVGDIGDPLARQLHEQLNMLLHAWNSRDPAVFKRRFKEVSAFVGKYGFGEGTGRDFYAEAAAGRTGIATKGVREGLQLISKAVNMGRPVRKGATFDSFVQEGIDYDIKCSQLLMAGARGMAEATGEAVTDCIVAIAKHEPELWECHSRAASRLSRAYWSKVYDQG